MSVWYQIRFPRQNVVTSTPNAFLMSMPADSPYAGYLTWIPAKSVVIRKFINERFFMFSGDFRFFLEKRTFDTERREEVTSRITLSAEEMLAAWLGEAEADRVIREKKLKEEAKKAKAEAKRQAAAAVKVLPTGRYAADEVSVADVAAAKKVDVRILWFEWLCPDNELESRGAALLRKLRSILPTKRFNPDECGVFFRNARSERGRLFDAMTLFERKSGRPLYFITAAGGFTGSVGKAQLWDLTVEGGKLLVNGEWPAVKAWFLEPSARQ